MDRFLHEFWWVMEKPFVKISLCIIGIALCMTAIMYFNRPIFRPSNAAIEGD